MKEGSHGRRERGGVAVELHIAGRRRGQFRWSRRGGRQFIRTRFFRRRGRPVFRPGKYSLSEPLVLLVQRKQSHLGTLRALRPVYIAKFGKLVRRVRWRELVTQMMRGHTAGPVVSALAQLQVGSGTAAGVWARSCRPFTQLQVGRCSCVFFSQILLFKPCFRVQTIGNLIQLSGAYDLSTKHILKC
jgi:hypothetical protein